MTKDTIAGLRAWMHEPDYIEDGFSLESVVAWINRRPIGAFEQMASELATLRESLAKAEGERDEARSLAGLGCDAANGGAHTIMTHPGGYTFCGGCGYTIKNPTLTERARKAEARALAAEAALTETRAMLAEAVAERDGLREAMSRRREALAGDRCQCDAPMIRCDMHGCRCTRCGLPESRARSTLTKIQEAGHAG